MRTPTETESPTGTMMMMTMTGSLTVKMTIMKREIMTRIVSRVIWSTWRQYTPGLALRSRNVVILMATLTLEHARDKIQR